METCRVCGISSLEEGKVESLEKYVPVYIRLTSLQFHAHEDPTALKICQTCVEKLSDFETFLQHCIEVHWKLQAVKVEPSDEDQGTDCMQYDYEDEKNPFDTKTENESFSDLDDNDDETSETKISISHFIPSVELVKDEFLPEDDPEPQQKKKRTKQGNASKPSKPVQHTCDRCEEVFQDLKLFTAHKRMHDGLKPFVCEICTIDFETLLEMNLHSVQNHTERKILVCPDCGEQFTSYQALRSHKTRMHDPNYEPPAPPEPKGYICETCGKIFKDKQKLTHHRYTHNPEDKPHICQICFMKFARPDKLRLHVMRHEDIRNYLCPFCGVRKITRTELMSHMKNIHKLEQSALGDTKLESLIVCDSNLVNATSDTESPGPSSASQVGSKRTRNESQWLNNVRKTCRNSGKAYVNKHNVEFKEKTFPKQFDCGCPRKCPTLFSSESVVEAFFTSFWNLSDWHKQNGLLTEMVKPGDVNRRRSTSSLKSVTFHYHIPDGSENKKVCKKYFLSILQVSAGRLYRCLGKR